MIDLNKRFFPDPAACLFFASLIFHSVSFLFNGSLFSQEKNNYFSLIRETSGELVYAFHFPDPDIEHFVKDGKTYHRITAPDFSVSLQPGIPPLPVVQYLLELPDGAASVQVLQEETSTKTGIHLIPDIDLATGDSAEVSRDTGSSSWLSSDTWLPAATVRLNFIGKFRDIPLHRLILCPYRYHPSQSKLEIRRRMTVKIKFASGKKNLLTEPLSGDAERFLKNQVINYSSAKKNRQWQPKSIAKKTRTDNTLTRFQSSLPLQYVKITVGMDGIYKITQQELAHATRLNLQSVDPRTFQLFSRGIQVPVYIQGESDGMFDAGDYIEFFGEKYYAKFNPYLSGINPQTGHYIDPWSDDNVYFLIWGGEPGIRLIEENGGVRQDTGLIRPSFYPVCKHFEEDNTQLDVKDINLIEPSANEDIWAFDGGVTFITPGTGSQSTREYSFSAERPDRQFLRVDTLRVNFQGISTGLHYVEVFLNDVLLTPSAVTWYGPSKKQVDIPIPPGPGALNNGNNRLRINTPPTSDRNLDMLALNWFEVSYQRSYQADETGTIAFNGGPVILPSLVHQFEIREFKSTSVSVYKKGISKITGWDIDSSSFGRTYKIVFQDAVHSAETEYIAIEERSKLKPKSIILDTLVNLTGVSHDSRYLVIAPKMFHSSAKRLTGYRQGRGLSAEIIDIEDIYDQFNFGVKSPYAIRDFLRFTQQSPYWQGSQGPPLYVLLIGDGSSRPKKSQNEIIPVQMMQTFKFGPAASDTWYAQMSDGDIVPDLFIGRFPVTTVSELNAVIDKTIQYEQNQAAGSWKNRVTFIGGSQETRGIGQNSDIPADVFRYQSSKIINQTLPPRFSYDRIYAYPAEDQFFGGANQVIQTFSEGKLLVAYLGHGGGGIWGDLDIVTGKPLLNDNQVQEFQSNSGKWPVVLSMTCFVGAFDNDGKALGEILLNTPGKGAVGVLAASGVGWIRGDYQMLDQTIKPILTPGTTAGAAVSEGKLNYLILNGQDDFNSGDPLGNLLGASYVPPSMVFQFNYLGDPALQLNTPAGQSCTVSNLSPLRTDSITVSGNSPFQSGTGVLEIYQLKPVKDSVSYGGNIESYVTVYIKSFSITAANYQTGVNLGLIHDTLLHAGFAGVRVYGESSGGQQYFSAYQVFQVGGAFLSEVQTVPSVLTSSDTIRFSAKASDPQGIRHVIARHERIGTVNTPGLADTLYPAGNDYYLSGPIGPYSETDQIRYRITVTDLTGDSTASPQLYVNTVHPGIDMSIGSVAGPGYPITGRIYLAGTDRVRIHAIVENLGILQIPKVYVRFYRNDPRTTGVFLGEDSIALAGSVPNAGQIARDTASVTCALSSGTHNVFAWIDTLRQYNDVNRVNNLGYNTLTIDHFNVTPGFGTTLNFSKNDTVSVDQGFAINIPAQAVGQNTVLKISRVTAQSSIHQPDIRFAQIRGVTGPAAFMPECSRFDEVFTNQKTVFVRFAYDTLLYPQTQPYRDSLGVYTWDRGNRRWRLVGYDTEGIPGEIRVQVSSGSDIGPLTLMINQDRTSPLIEPNVEGQYFSQGAIVSRNPKISAIIYDRNGVSLNKKDYAVQIDGDLLSADRLILPDSSANSNTVQLSLNLPQSFEAGEHTLSFQAKDVNRNASVPVELRFSVVNQFRISLIGNFPNPFSNTTTIAYRVEAPEDLDRLTISVYTVSGRRVRRFSSDEAVGGPPLNSIGYHEVIWDATDDGGHGVANGIYFYMIRGKLKGKTVEQRGKIAYFR